VIVGTKLAHYSGYDWTPLERTVEAGELANGIPAMIDFGGANPPLSIKTLLLEKLRPGDIYAHCYAHVGGRMPVVDEHGKVRPCVLEAQEKGIAFEVGHGGGSFLFEQALPALEQGFLPDMISTDLHTGSMNAGMKDMLNVMSKFLNMGMSLEEVVARSTWSPAVHINRKELGHLSVGAGADIALLKLREGDFGFTDVKGWKIHGDKKLECELTLMEGKVVWDLNGISMQEWQSSK
jgi:dihydroorotase